TVDSCSLGLVTGRPAYLLFGPFPAIWFRPLVLTARRWKARKVFKAASRSDARQFLTQRTACRLQFGRVWPIRSVCGKLSPIRMEAESFNGRWLRTSMAGGRSRDLLSLRRPEADGS